MTTKAPPKQTPGQQAALRELQRLHDHAAAALLRSATTHLRAASKVERLLLSHSTHTVIQASPRLKGLR